MKDVQRVSLEQLVDPDRPITYGVVKPGEDPGAGGVLLIRSGDVLNGRIAAELRRITPEVSQAYRRTLLRGGELIISLVGNPGSVAVVPSSLAGANLARQVGLVALRGDVDARFVMYSFMADECRNALTAVTKGSVQQVVNLADVKRLQVPLPPRPEQQRIADILAAYDDLIEVNHRRIAVLENMARGLFEEWFIRFCFPGHEAVAIKDSADGPLPSGWSFEQAEEIIFFDPPTKLAKSGTKPFLSMSDLETETSLTGPYSGRIGNSGAKFQNGDTLFARITPCLENGKTGLVRDLSPEQPVGFGSTEFIVMRERRAGPAFTYCLARHDGFRRFAQQGMSGASGRQRVATDKLRRFPLAAPGDDWLFRRFETVAGPMFDLVGKLGAANRRLADARDLLLPRLLSGRLSLRAAERELAEAA